MQFRELTVLGAFEFAPRKFPDARGLFTAPFQEDTFVEAVGHTLHLAQTNYSVSRRGVIRGVHFADTPPGQAKYISCPAGALLDVVVDLRVGSPTFGRYDATVLDDKELRAVYVPEGVGHAFVALEDDTAMSYLCSTAYNPGGEHGISPFDTELALPWPTDIETMMSEKDRNAPSLAEAMDSGLLPQYDDCLKHYETLRGT